MRFAALAAMMPTMPVLALRLAGSLCVALALGACGTGLQTDATNYPETRNGKPVPYPQAERETIFGPGGMNFMNVFNGKGSEGGGGGGAGIGVNTYLWRAALDTIAFMPLTSADPFGGVIITDWHTPPETPDERFKMTVYILDRQLRADGLKVSVFRQTRRGADWVDVPVTTETAVQLENAMLTRARQIRVDSAAR